MNIDELKKARDFVETQYLNFADASWVHSQLQYLKGKFDLLSELITNESAKVEETKNAPTKEKPSRQ